MKSKNHIKNPNEDSLRGIGKLGWTEAGKMHGDLKRLSASFDDDGVSPGKKKRIVVECPKCKRKFKTVSGNLPVHKARFFSYPYNGDKYCTGGVPEVPPVDIEEAKTFYGDVLKVGDIISFTLPRKNFFLKFISEMHCGKIVKIQQHSNKSISFEIEGGGRVFGLQELTKNLIYLTEEEYNEFKGK